MGAVIDSRWCFHWPADCKVNWICWCDIWHCVNRILFRITCEITLSMLLDVQGCRWIYHAFTRIFPTLFVTINVTPKFQLLDLFPTAIQRYEEKKIKSKSQSGRYGRNYFYIVFVLHKCLFFFFFSVRLFYLTHHIIIV